MPACGFQAGNKQVRNSISQPVITMCCVENRQKPSRSITRTETIGFVVIALVILALILARWGNLIPWSAR